MTAKRINDKIRQITNQSREPTFMGEEDPKEKENTHFSPNRFNMVWGVYIFVI